MDEAKPQSEGMDFAISSLAEARRRLAAMDKEEKLRDSNEIWEAYCDVEQAIEVSKFVFKLHNQLGKVRMLKVSAKNDPSTLPLSELVARYKSVDSAIASADNALREGRGEVAIEFARRARDELKILLMGKRKMERAKARKK